MHTQTHTNKSDGPDHAIDTQFHDVRNAGEKRGGWIKRGLARRLVAAIAAIGIAGPFLASLDATPAQAAATYTNTYACFQGQFETGSGLRTTAMPYGVPVKVFWLSADQSQYGLYTTIYTDRNGCAAVHLPAGYYWGMTVDHSIRYLATLGGWKSWRYYGVVEWQWVTANNWYFGTFYLQRTTGS